MLGSALLPAIAERGQAAASDASSPLRATLSPCGGTAVHARFAATSARCRAVGLFITPAWCRNYVAQELGRTRVASRRLMTGYGATPLIQEWEQAAFADRLSRVRRSSESARWTRFCHHDRQRRTQEWDDRGAPRHSGRGASLSRFVSLTISRRCEILNEDGRIRGPCGPNATSSDPAPRDRAAASGRTRRGGRFLAVGAQPTPQAAARCVHRRRPAHRRRRKSPTVQVTARVARRCPGIPRPAASRMERPTSVVQTTRRR